jgi:hypothetical protein
MKKEPKEIYFNIGARTRITLTGYHWRTAILDWVVVGKPVHYVSIQVLRFKFEWVNYGDML